MGLDLGLEQAGIEPTLAIEMDGLCCATMQKNRPGYDVWKADISSLDSQAILARHNNPKDVFLMVGGPPCQSFCSGASALGLLTHAGISFMST